MTEKNRVSDSTADEFVSSAREYYDRGNYRAVHTMIDAANHTDIGDDAREELDRLDENLRPDPYARGLAILSFLLFLSVLGLVYLQ